MSFLRRDKNGISFGATVPATEIRRLTYDVTNDATVESASVRIYRGAENTLQLRLKHLPEQGAPSDLVETVGPKQYIDGDDERYDWNLGVPVEDGSVVVVEAENTDGINAHNFRVNVDLDYLGGTERAVRGLAEAAGVV